jgi:DNA-binding MarR family transcriptional regulator
MSYNHFKRGELYSVLTGMASIAIARRLQKNFRQAGLDISVEQWSVLYHLWKEDGLSQQELCVRSFRDKPSVTRLLDNMEKQGLVKRMPSPSDRRINLVMLTDISRDLKDSTTELANTTMNEGLDGVTTAEIAIVKKVLQQVYDNLTGTEIKNKE